MEVPKAVLDRLAALEQMVAEKGSLRSAREQEEERLQAIRKKSIFAGLGEPKIVPYTHQDYPHRLYNGKVIQPPSVKTASGDLVVPEPIMESRVVADEAEEAAAGTEGWMRMAALVAHKAKEKAK